MSYNLCVVNTVGSFAKVNKYWQKQWIDTKRDLVLSQEQRSVMIGSMLGDGTLRVGDGAINANLKIEHGLAQQKYVRWKYDIFRPWVFTEPKISYRYRPSGERYPKSLWFRTIRHPIITEFQRRFYVDGRKIVPHDISDDLDELALAVWVMDDGNLNRRNISISTYSFTLGEIELLVKVLQSRFALSAKYYRDRDKGYRMYFTVGDTKKLTRIIGTYVIPELRYKIDLKQ